MNSFGLSHPFRKSLLSSPQGGPTPLPMVQFVPGHTGPSPLLGQGPIQEILQSPWLDIGFKAGTATLLLVLALSLEGLPRVLSSIAGGYWVYRTVDALIERVEIKEKVEPTPPVGSV